MAPIYAYKPPTSTVAVTNMKPRLKLPVRICKDYHFRNVVNETTYANNREMVDALEEAIPPSNHADRQIFSAYRDTDRSRFVYRFWPSYMPFMAAPIMNRDATMLQNNEISVSSAPFIGVHTLKLLGEITGKRVLQVGFGKGYLTEIIAKLVGPRGQVCASEKDNVFAGLARESIRLGRYGPELMERIELFSKTSVALEKGPFDAIVFCCAVDMPTLQQFGHYVHKSGVVVAPVDFGFGSHYLTKYVPDMNFALVLASIPRIFLPYEDEFKSFEPQTDTMPVKKENPLQPRTQGLVLIQ